MKNLIFEKIIFKNSNFDKKVWTNTPKWSII